ncbi:MAG: hypothetical protein NZV14_15915 [Bryobacteraceae bacterium]|nr:hypothetical protein [Bryobacteraceae bacterium]MDW8379647.1 hypothetical protein [Bryobacterales bacterium]
MISQVKQLLRHVVPSVIKPVRVLWNEMIGFIFLLLGLVPLPSAYKAYRDFEGGKEGVFRLVLTACFCGVMLYFGIASFLRARKISRT